MTHVWGTTREQSPRAQSGEEVPGLETVRPRGETPKDGLGAPGRKEGPTLYDYSHTHVRGRLTFYVARQEPSYIYFP